MRFGPNADQQLVQRAAREHFARVLPSEALRRALDDTAFPRAIWDGLASQGWLGALVADEHGGSGLVLSDLAVAIEESGRALAPVPFVETAVVAALAIARLASRDRASEWLPRIATGELIVTVTLSGGLDQEPRSVVARPDGDAWILDGTAALVPFGADADLVILLAHEADGTSALFAIPRGDGMRSSAVAHTDRSARAARLELGGMRVPDDHRFSAKAQGLSSIIRAARAALCADMLGGAQRALELSIDYAKQRVQFDRPIGSFQAIKHKLADMDLAVEQMRGLVYASLSAVDADVAEDPIVEVAKAACNDGYTSVTNDGIQVHGGIGFTWEHDMHLYYKRALRLASTLGTSRELRYGVGRALLDGKAWTTYEDRITAGIDASPAAD